MKHAAYEGRCICRPLEETPPQSAIHHSVQSKESRKRKLSPRPTDDPASSSYEQVSKRLKMEGSWNAEGPLEEISLGRHLN